MNQEPSTSHNLENEKWTYTLSKGKDFTINGLQHKELLNIVQQSTQGKIINFGNFGINTSHIISFEKIDSGYVALPQPDKYKEISDEQRERNLERLEEIKRKVLK